jgi:hydrogenase/urease accessory protein HupE
MIVHDLTSPLRQIEKMRCRTRSDAQLARFLWPILAGLLLMVSPAAGHPEGFSGLAIDLEPGQVRMRVTLYTRDLDNWFPPRMFSDYVPDVCRALEAQGPQMMRVELNGIAAAPIRVTASQKAVGILLVEWIYPTPPGQLKSLSVENRTFDKLSSGLIQPVSVEDRRALPIGSTAPARRLDDATLNLDSPLYVLEPVPPPLAPGQTAPPPKTRKGAGFFLAGVRHILSGYDHLLFVAALLLACRTLREAVTIITFFTLAHSITLTLAAMDLIRLSSRIVEPAIAATILFVAVENLVHRPNLRVRCAITFFFGLIHGLGFASDLREMFQDTSFAQIIWPLLKFSAGVETGHLTLVTMALPVLLYLRNHRPVFDRKLVPACSIAISLVGGYWLAVRLVAAMQLHV